MQAKNAGLEYVPATEAVEPRARSMVPGAGVNETKSHHAKKWKNMQLRVRGVRGASVRAGDLDLFKARPLSRGCRVGER